MVVGFTSSNGYKFQIIDPRAAGLAGIDSEFEFDSKRVIENIVGGNLVMLGLATMVRHGQIV
eukprot:SAG31_NODE_1288_length_8994_cov_4.105003_5_plen_62_part_00